jgi:hypothetical protein
MWKKTAEVFLNRYLGTGEKGNHKRIRQGTVSGPTEHEALTVTFYSIAILKK